MTIVHLITGLGGGGAEHMVLELSKNAQKNKIKTIVISITNANKIEDKFKAEQIEYHFLGINSPKSLFSGLSQFKSILKPHQNITMHCHMFHACMLGIIYKLFYKQVPMVFTMHTNSVKQLYRRLLLALTKPFRKSDIIFSDNSKKWYLKNSIVIPNGVDFQKLATSVSRELSTTKPFSFLFLGRLFGPKNPLFLVDLVQKLIKKGHKNFVIDLVGDGPLKSDLMSKIEQTNTKAYFNLHGFQNNVKPFLQEAHALILPSLWEGMPVTIIEASASKLPIITTPVGSIPDFLNDTNAKVVDLTHFDQAMIEVMTNYAEAKSKANTLYNEINATFHIDFVFDKHLKLYQSVS